MLQIIAFSFNRAMQLDTLLSSLINKWNSPNYHIDVVYNYSNDTFGEGYKKLIKDYSGKPVTLHREDSTKPDKVSLFELTKRNNLAKLWRNPRLRHPKTNFRSLVINILEQSKADNVMFLTDDSMFVKPVSIPQEIFNWVNEKPRDRQFSLRLGKGISTLPSTISINNEYCNWDLYQHTGSWGYPFSVDAHVYNKQVILKLFKKYIFTNPNTLEADIVSVVGRGKYFAEGRCFTEIKMLTFPINIVQNAIDNISQNVSVEMLNERYLKGEHLEYVVDEQYDATKQYVRQIKFISNEGNATIVPISDEIIHPNAKL